MTFDTEITVSQEEYIDRFKDKWCVVILESQITEEQLSDISSSLKQLMKLGFKFQIVVNHSVLLRDFWKKNGSWDDTPLLESEEIEEGIALRSALKISHSLSFYGIKSQLITDIQADQKGIDGFSNLFVDEPRLSSLMDSNIIPILVPIFLKPDKTSKCADSIEFAQEAARIADAEKLIIVSTSCQGLSYHQSAISHLSTDEATVFVNSESIPHEIKKYIESIVNFISDDTNNRRGHIIGVGNNDLVKELLTVDGIGLMINDNTIPGEPIDDSIKFRIVNDETNKIKHEYLHESYQNITLNNNEKFSDIAIQEEAYLNDYPKKLTHSNTSISTINLPIPGVLEIIGKNNTDFTLIFSCGMHGDERAGIEVVDTLVSEIVFNKLPVNSNILFIYGNLKAMSANDGKGLRCIEPEKGWVSNLNRCFIDSDGNSLNSYAQERANLIMTEGLNHLVSGKIEVLDIHQSFKVPLVGDVRDNSDRTEYTFALVSPHDRKSILEWVYEKYSDIVTGVVLNNINSVSTTFSGFMANKYKANAATLELGTIGYSDFVSFTPQLTENIRNKIKGSSYLDRKLGFDIWEVVGFVFKKSANFTFLDKNGEKTNSCQCDFMPLDYTEFAQDENQVFTIKNNECLLFANSQVPIGDRAAVIIRKSSSELIPKP